MKGIFFSAILLLTTICLSAQNDTIEVVGKNGNRFKKEGVNLTPGQLKNYTLEVPEAHEYMEKAYTNYSASNVFSFIGGALIGYPIGTALGGGEPIWAMVGVGAAFIGISLPFYNGYIKNAKKAVSIYNEHKKSADQSNLRMNLNPAGVQFSYSF